MGKYNIHAGHCPQGQGASGASGLLQESVDIFPFHDSTQGKTLTLACSMDESFYYMEGNEYWEKLKSKA